MYDRIPNSAIQDKKKMSAREEAAHYAVNRKVYEEIRYAYRCGYIDRQQMLTLRGKGQGRERRVRDEGAGDSAAEGALVICRR